MGLIKKHWKLACVIVHLAPGADLASQQLQLFLANGVTTVRNMIGKPEHLQLRDRVAKGELPGSFALSLEQPATLLQNIVTQTLYGLPANYWDTYPQSIAAVTAEDVQRVARKYLDPANLQIVAVGDAAKVREPLTKYGAVEAFNAEGKPVPSQDN